MVGWLEQYGHVALYQHVSYTRKNFQGVENQTMPYVNSFLIYRELQKYFIQERNFK